MKKSLSKVISFIMVLTLVMVSFSQLAEAAEEVSLTVTGQSTSSSTGRFDWVLVPGVHNLDHYMIDVDGAGFVEYGTSVNNSLSGLELGSEHTITVQGYEMLSTTVEAEVPTTLEAIFWLLEDRFPGEWQGIGWYCTIDNEFVRVATEDEGLDNTIIYDKGTRGELPDITFYGSYDTVITQLIPGEPQSNMFITGSAKFTVVAQPTVVVLPTEVSAPLYTVRVATYPVGVNAAFSGYGTGFANGEAYSVAIDTYDTARYVFTGFTGSASGTISGADVQIIANFVQVAVEQPIPEEPIPQEPVVEEPISEVIVVVPVVEEPIVEEPIDEEPIIVEPIDEEIDNEEVVDGILDEEVAQDDPLPNTGGVPMEAFSILGLALVAVGAKLRKKN